MNCRYLDLKLILPGIFLNNHSVLVLAGGLFKPCLQRLLVPVHPCLHLLQLLHQLELVILHIQYTQHHRLNQSCAELENFKFQSTNSPPFHLLYFMHIIKTTRWQYSVVVSALPSIKVVNQHRVRLLHGWVTACGQVNRLDM